MTISAGGCACEPEDKIVMRRVCRICGRLQHSLDWWLFFMAIRFSSKLWRRSLSKPVVPLLMVAHHVTRFRAAFCHLSVSTEVFSDAFSVSLSLAQLGKEELLWQTVVFHACNMPAPSKFELSWGGLQCRAFLCRKGFPDLVCVHPIQRAESCGDSVAGTAPAFLCDACKQVQISHPYDIARTRAQLPCLRDGLGPRHLDWLRS